MKIERAKFTCDQFENCKFILNALVTIKTKGRWRFVNIKHNICFYKNFLNSKMLSLVP